MRPPVLQLKLSFFFFLCSLHTCALIPVRDPQPPRGHAMSQGMCPCYSPSKVFYGLVTGSPEVRHLLLWLSENPQTFSKGRGSKGEKGRIKTRGRGVKICIKSCITALQLQLKSRSFLPSFLISNHSF